ncbi:MAG TPA: bacteriohopanetetrol glucosamine biosynthesis glycosyltransferase HpnI [Rhizomicrobium sp.]|jgi:ceramide glucosyltransferase|nr:bacteriohopanetetrol glucosamine biosynthesis glycosyltransferase HpnI [Rhizomicrobium sp.]
MTGIQDTIGIGLALLAFVAAGFTTAAAFAVGIGVRSARSALRPAVPVTLLKPLHLAEAGLQDNLRSFLRQDYEAPVQIVFGATSQTDPALGVVESLRRDFPDADIEAVADPKRLGTNPKVANLINMAAHAKYDLLIVSDSDIRVPADYLRRIIAAFQEPNVGAVSLLYAGKALGNLWSKLAAMNIDYHFVPNARLGMALGLAHPCFGSTIALRRRTLAEIGGFETLSDVLADDYELGRAVRACGYRVIIADCAVEHICSEENALALFRQEVRWAKTNLLLARSGYIGSIVTYPLPLALLAVLFQGFGALSLSALAWALAARLFLVFKVRRRLGAGSSYVWLLPLRDVLSFFVYLASFFGKTVEWRGHRFSTGADGALAPLWR